MLVATADYPAAASYGPWVASTSAGHPCRHCRWQRPKKLAADSDDEDSDDDDVSRSRIPSSSRVQADERGKHFTTCNEDEYTWPQIAAELQEIQEITVKKDRKAKMSQCGFNTTVFPLHPAHLPHVDPARMQPEDIMHLFLCGITRYELYYLLEHLVKRKIITWESLNTRIASMRIPKGKRIPKIQGAAKGKKISERNLDMTASETFMFAKLR